MGSSRVMDAILSPLTYEEAQSQDYITGQRVIQDMGTCNFTRLMLGPAKARSFMPMFLFLVVFFNVISCLCLPLSVCTRMLWYILFPIVLFWSLYNVSPMCWPMVPPRFVHDLYGEVSALMPTEFGVPRYLVKPECTVDGRLSDGSYDPACFNSCSEAPFLFKSWQDTLTWWICEISTDACEEAGRQATSFGIFQDMASSADYYASVIDYATKNPELVQAHRLCAVLSTYNLIWVALVLGIACYLLPSICMAVLDILTGCLILIMETYNTPI
jgi:hypothetical protein